MDKIIKYLIDDEIEAITGYNKAIKALSDNPEVVAKLTEIRNEEAKHIVELNQLLKEKK